MEKREIRREVLSGRDALSEAERMRGSLLLTERILGHQWFYRSEIILGFVNYGSEISTREILEASEDKPHLVLESAAEILTALKE